MIFEPQSFLTCLFFTGVVTIQVATKQPNCSQKRFSLVESLEYLNFRDKMRKSTGNLGKCSRPDWMGYGVVEDDPVHLNRMSFKVPSRAKPVL